MARAKCRELIHLLELYVEWPAHRLYPAAHFGGTASDDTRKEVAATLARGVKAFARVARFEPFVFGAAFTYADCAALWHLPLVSSTTRAIYGEDLLASVPGVAEYLRDVGARPHARSVNEARKTGMEAFIAYRAKLAAQAHAGAGAQSRAPAR